jgi:hypothetical protein
MDSRIDSIHQLSLRWHGPDQVLRVDFRPLSNEAPRSDHSYYISFKSIKQI